MTFESSTKENKYEYGLNVVSVDTNHHLRGKNVIYSSESIRRDHLHVIIFTMFISFCKIYIIIHLHLVDFISLVLILEELNYCDV